MTKPDSVSDDASPSACPWRTTAAILWPLIVFVLYARLALIPGVLVILGLE